MTQFSIPSPWRHRRFELQQSIGNLKRTCRPTKGHSVNGQLIRHGNELVTEFQQTTVIMSSDRLMSADNVGRHFGDRQCRPTR